MKIRQTIRQIMIASLLCAYFCSDAAFSVLRMELTQGVAGAIPIAVLPFAVKENTDVIDNLSAIIAHDLQNSGRFKVVGQTVLLSFPKEAHHLPLRYFHRLGIDNLVLGSIKQTGAQSYQVNFQLLDVFRGKGTQSILLAKQFTATNRDFRQVAHRISDLIYYHLLGIQGVFSTKLAYVVKQRTTEGLMRYQLEISDQDGENTHSLLDSPHPIMSPAWSPQGQDIAYVSFEKRRAAIYIQNVSTGKLQQVTHDWYINTEPVWAPDGQSLLFTSNRGGSPQIYQVKLATPEKISRLSYEGDYNARPAVSGDGKWIAMIHRVGGAYQIAMLNLINGTTQVVSPSSEENSTSPSLAPNGSMILYDTIVGNHRILAMVSAEGNVQIQLPARHGEAEDPAWSPYQTRE